jgi:hypothetical protein
MEFKEVTHEQANDLHNYLRWRHLSDAGYWMRWGNRLADTHLAAPTYWYSHPANRDADPTHRNSFAS